MLNYVTRIEFLESGNRLLFLTLVIAAFLAFWKLGAKDIEDWDEARQIINAVEMEHRGNYVDYFYDDKIDTWSSKPPLLIWSMVASYKFLGTSIFSSRLPNAIASIAFFCIVFSFVRLYRSRWFAFGTCLILMSCRAVFEAHIGRTADFDGFLILFLAGFSYFFVRHHDFGHRTAILWAGVCLGLAFYSKGTTSVFLLPGALLYTLVSGTFLQQLKNRVVWITLLIYLIIAGSWLSLSGIYGAGFDETQSVYGSSNSWTTMFFNDTWDRFVGQAAFENERGAKPFYFFVILDILMNGWNYVFYLGVILGSYSLIRLGNGFKKQILNEQNRLLTLSFCMIITIMLLLEMSATKMGWYYAPMFMFVAVIVAETMAFVAKKSVISSRLVVVIIAVLFAKQFVFMDSRSSKTTEWLEENIATIEESDSIFLIGDTRPGLYAQLKLINYHSYLGLPSVGESNAGSLYVYRSEGNSGFVSSSCNEEFCLGTKLLEE